MTKLFSKKFTYKEKVIWEGEYEFFSISFKNKKLMMAILIPFMIPFVVVSFIVFNPNTIGQDVKNIILHPYFPFAIAIALFCMIAPSLFFIYRPIYQIKKRKKKLSQTGQKEITKIIMMEDTGIKIGGKPYKKFTISILGETRSFNALVPIKNNFEPGSMIEILYNPQNPNELVGNC